MLFTAINNEIKKILSLKTIVYSIIILLIVPITINLIGIIFIKLISIKINDAIYSTYWLMIKYIIPFCSILISNRLFTYEIKNKSIINTLIRPISKLKVYYSKVLANAIFCLILLSLTIFLSIIINMIVEGTEEDKLLKSIIIILVNILPIIVISSFSSMISQLTRRRISNFIIYYTIFFSDFLFGNLFPKFYQMTINSNISYYISFLGEPINYKAIGLDTFISVGHIFLFLGFGIYLFSKKKF